VDIGVQQDEALLDENIRKYNRLYDQMLEIEIELRRRGRSARIMLKTLFDHSNIQVRLKAATAIIGIMPKRSRRVLEKIRESQEYPQAADAGMLIRAVDSGRWKPT